MPHSMVCPDCGQRVQRVGSSGIWNLTAHKDSDCPYRLTCPDCDPSVPSKPCIECVKLRLRESGIIC